MIILYDIAETLLREYNKILKRNEVLDDISISAAKDGMTYQDIKYRVKNSYVTLTSKKDGKSANVFYDRVSGVVLKDFIDNQSGRLGFPLLASVGTTIRSVIPSINKAYGLTLLPQDVVDGPFDPLSATSVVIKFLPDAVYFTGETSITFKVLGSYALEDNAYVIKPTAYTYLPGVWDENMSGQTGVKTHSMLQTARVDYSAIAHVLQSFQGTVYTADSRLINTAYPRNFMLLNALKSVDGMPWLLRATDDVEFNLFNSHIGYNGPAKQAKGYFCNVWTADKLVAASANLIDESYDRVMIITMGIVGKMYGGCAIIHYNLS